MKTLIGLIQLFVFSSALLAGPSTDARDPVQPGLGKWWKNSEMVKTLQLSDAQVDRIEQTFLRHRVALTKLYSELQKRESELKTLMKADPIDESRIQSQTQLVVTSRAALEVANAAMLLAIRRDLKKEQWEKLQEIRELRASGLAVPIPAAQTPPLKDPQSGGKIYRVGADPIEAPICLYQPMPRYTQEARDAKIEGLILLQGVIRKNGRIDGLKVLSGLGYGLDKSAFDTVAKEWRFKPGMLNGQPVDVLANIEISFRLY
jgi:TonB family protein